MCRFRLPEEMIDEYNFAIEACKKRMKQNKSQERTLNMIVNLYTEKIQKILISEYYEKKQRILSK